MSGYVNLINPPQEELYDPSAYPHLGLLYLGAVLKKDGFKVRYVDLAEGKDYKIPKADCHLITITTPTYNSAMKVIRGIDDGGRILVGGIHPSVCPNDFDNDITVVKGEAEKSISDILSRRTKEKVIDCEPIKDLDSLPFPARDLIPKEKLRHLGNVHGDSYKGDGAATTIISSRGCPFRCNFCCKIHQTEYARYRSAENVKQEIVECQEKYDIHHFRFVDDIFTLNRKRVYEICRALKPLDVFWMTITRADSVDQNMLNSMFNAGCREVALGIESGSQRVLDLMGKRESPEQFLRAIAMIKDAGMKVKCFFMYGYPGETEHDIELTKKFIKRAKPDKWTVSRFVPLPGSDIWNNPKKYGIKIDKNYDNYWFYSEEDNELKNYLRGSEWRD